MTTTKDTNRVIGLVAKARATEFDGERAECMRLATKLVEKYELPASLLTDPTPQATSAARSGYTPPERRYPCRFGCGVFVQHTVDEMSECAERRRNETGSESAYDTAGRSFFDDLFASYRREYTAGYQGGAHQERASYTSREQRQREKTETFRRAYGGAAGSERPADEPKPHRRQRSHAHCDHEPTKAARARCRKMGGPLS